MAKRPRSPSPRKDASDDLDHDFWVSEAIHDRTSFFKAFFSPTMPAKELQNLDQIKDASHRILAWRSPSSQRTLVGNVRTLETGTDDDGERYGGRHVLKVIEEMRVEGALVVARWYGGIMLGPARFAHIENSARDAIRAWRQNEDSEGQKRRRVEDEDMEKASLIVELADRDQNILVLRRLLEEKTKQALSTTEQKPPSRPPIPVPDYSTMPLERLRQFDKARDSTVAFLLKKIDEAERQNGPKSIICPSPKPSRPVQTRSETKELDNAATEDLVLKNEPVITKEESRTASNAERDSASEPKSVKLASLNPFEEESSDDDDDS